MKEETPYLNHINYFRGIAIVFIVFGHCFNVGFSHYYQNSTPLAIFLQNLIPGGTTFFVFISGYLFHHIYYKNFNLRDFLIKKLKYVIVPFLFISSIDIFYYLSRYIIAIILSSTKSEIYLAILKSHSSFNTYLIGHGEMTIGLWYIPFITIIFSLSTVFIKYVKIKPNIQLIIINILLIFSILIHRNGTNSILGIFQNVIYFTPVYLLGISMSINFKKIYEKLKGKEIFILLITLSIAIIQTRIVVVDLILSNNLKIENFDLMIIQKILFSIFFILFLFRYDYKKIKILNLLAENSFGIFFIHGICIWIFNVIVLKLKISFETSSFLIYLLISSLILTFSLSITILIRKQLPMMSKYIIGC